MESQTCQSYHGFGHFESEIVREVVIEYARQASLLRETDPLLKVSLEIPHTPSKCKSDSTKIQILQLPLLFCVLEHSLSIFLNTKTALRLRKLLLSNSSQFFCLHSDIYRRSARYKHNQTPAHNTTVSLYLDLAPAHPKNMIGISPYTCPAIRINLSQTSSKILTAKCQQWRRKLSLLQQQLEQSCQDQVTGCLASGRKARKKRIRLDNTFNTSYRAYTMFYFRRHTPPFSLFICCSDKWDTFWGVAWNRWIILYLSFGQD